MARQRLVRSGVPGPGQADRGAHVRRALIVALAWAKAQLAVVRREDYADERAFRTALARRRKAVRRVERMLHGLGGVAAG